MVNRTRKELAILTQVGNNIKAVRISKQVSQQDLAIVVGMQKANLSIIEAGITNATIGSLFRIAKALNVYISDLLAPQN